MKQTLLITAIILSFIFNLQAQAQTGSIKGIVTDDITIEPIAFANIVLKTDSNKVLIGGVSDLDGKYLIKGIPIGKYDLEISIIGYSRQLIRDVRINSGKALLLNVKLHSSTTELQAVTIVCYKEPLIHMEQCSSTSITRRQINRMPGRSANSVAVTVGGVFSNTNASMGSIRGSRSSSTISYIDGVRVIGSQVIIPNNESYKKINENEFESVYVKPLSTFSIDVDKASYSNVRRFLFNDQLPPKNAVRIEEMINYFHYDYPTPTEEKPFSISLEAAPCPWNSAHQIIQVGLKGKEIEKDQILRSNFVFLIDVSGSMSDINKLPLVKKSLKILIDKLQGNDRIAIVSYSESVRCELKSTAVKNKSKIYSAINKLYAGGSTAGGAGIQMAYEIAQKNFIKKGNNRVIMATDGDFNVGISDNDLLKEMIEKKRDEGVFLTILGYGMGNIKDNRMEMLADAGNGNYAYIDNILEAEKTLSTEMYGTLYTIAKDVKIQIEFNPAKIKAYRLIGYENRMLETEDFADDKKDAGEMGMGHYVTALYEVIPANSEEEMDHNTDSLKYQTRKLTESDELLTVKFRYKDPKDSISKLIVKSIKSIETDENEMSDNMLLASSVAEFGLLLRKSKYKGNATYGAVIKRMRKTLKNDDEGYRAEFIKMVKTARILES